MEEQTAKQKVSVSVPIGAIAAAALLGLAASAYVLLSRSDEESESVDEGKSRPTNMRRKLGLLTLITLIENDVTRKGVVALLRAIAKRS